MSNPRKNEQLGLGAPTPISTNISFNQFATSRRGGIRAPAAESSSSSHDDYFRGYESSMKSANSSNIYYNPNESINQDQSISWNAPSHLFQHHQPQQTVLESSSSSSSSRLKSNQAHYSLQNDDWSNYNSKEHESIDIFDVPKKHESSNYPLMYPTDRQDQRREDSDTSSGSDTSGSSDSDSDEDDDEDEEFEEEFQEFLASEEGIAALQAEQKRLSDLFEKRRLKELEKAAKKEAMRLEREERKMKLREERRRREEQREERGGGGEQGRNRSKKHRKKLKFGSESSSFLAPLTDIITGLFDPDPLKVSSKRHNKKNRATLEDLEDGRNQRDDEASADKMSDSDSEARPPSHTQTLSLSITTALPRRSGVLGSSPPPSPTHSSWKSRPSDGRGNGSDNGNGSEIDDGTNESKDYNNNSNNNNDSNDNNGGFVNDDSGDDDDDDDDDDEEGDEAFMEEEGKGELDGGDENEDEDDDIDSISTDDSDVREIQAPLIPEWVQEHRVTKLIRRTSLKTWKMMTMRNAAIAFSRASAVALDVTEVVQNYTIAALSWGIRLVTNRSAQTEMGSRILIRLQAFLDRLDASLSAATSSGGDTSTREGRRRHKSARR